MRQIEQIHKEFQARKKTLAIGESCTGGAIAARLVEIPGASQFLLGSVVAYTNRWKELFLHVSPETLRKTGAVSEETVEEMVMGLLALTGADIALAVSGIAGPDGGTKEKPVGTVFIAVGSREGRAEVLEIHVPGNRKQIIDGTVEAALEAVLRQVAR